jgi:hypothetical protein
MYHQKVENVSPSLKNVSPSLKMYHQKVENVSPSVENIPPSFENVSPPSKRHQTVLGYNADLLNITKQY